MLIKLFTSLVKVFILNIISYQSHFVILKQKCGAITNTHMLTYNFVHYYQRSSLPTSIPGTVRKAKRTAETVHN